MDAALLDTDILSEVLKGKDQRVLTKAQQYLTEHQHFACNRTYLPDHLWVWIHYGTSKAMRVFLHRTALVHAISPEQARCIAARLRNGKEH